ncbi:hypothetical protein ASG01_07420 [Chryseobacterium sp. Leaf180]|uniref:hypothetical protein n=1 Tax=Chryseobacterium sp. Leaf180 TaxID=1736289 RepID=UPI0006FCE2E8|nr:hypothetical protein [Chryseobacterium sp. Leaf180]KQR93696.1 hypothetical protein ASG01_07420 [Chryseobacterium sp. Leaf180]
MQSRTKLFPQKKKIRFTGGFFGKSLFSLLLFLVSHLSAQSTDSQEQNNSPSIVLTGGAKIYSDDAVFNAEIASKKITVKNAVVLNSKSGTTILTGKSSRTVAVKKNKKSHLIVRNRTQLMSATLAKQLKSLTDRKAKQNLSVIFHNEASDTYFTTGNSIRHFSILNHHDLSKIIFSKVFYYENILLSSFHYIEVNYYNTISLSYCSSDAFSQRPPPLLA